MKLWRYISSVSVCGGRNNSADKFSGYSGQQFKTEARSPPDDKVEAAAQSPTIRGLADRQAPLQSRRHASSLGLRPRPAAQKSGAQLVISLRKGRQFRLAQVILAGQPIVVPNVVCYIRVGDVGKSLRWPHYLRHFLHQNRLQLPQAVGAFLLGGGLAALARVNRPGRRTRRISVESEVHTDTLFGIADGPDPLPNQKDFLDSNPARTPLKVPPPCLPPPTGVGQPEPLSQPLPDGARGKNRVKYRNRFRARKPKARYPMEEP